MEGFVGGQCAESSVRAMALEVLDTGEAVLLRILPEGDDDFPEAPGARTVVNPCLSGGAIELFLAPHLPASRLVVIGHTPIADRAGRAGGDAGLPSRPQRRGRWCPARGDRRGGVEPRIRGGGGDSRRTRRWVGFIGLVASTRRGSAVLDELGLDDDERARVHTPVGLDIGARTPEEIALSIVAEVVKAIRVDGLVAAPGGDHDSGDDSDAPALPHPPRSIPSAA